MLSEVMSTQVTQALFGGLIGVSQQAVSGLVRDGTLAQGGTLGQWLLAYCARLREQAAGRLGSEADGLDLVQERAALAREQRIAQELKNAVARREYAPIGLLAYVLGTAASGVVDRLDMLEGQIKRAAPGLPDDALAAINGAITSARNEWIRSTAKLVDDSFEQGDESDDEDHGVDLFEEGEGAC